MGSGLIYEIITLTILLIVASISLWYFIRKKRSWIGIIISSGTILFVLSLVFINDIDRLTHTTTDVQNDLKLAKISLHDDFQIVDNEVHGMPERIQETSIEISSSDRTRLIEEIKSDPNFRPYSTEQILRNEMYSTPKTNIVVTTSYRFRDTYIRESYFKEDDYIPIHLIVRLNEDQNILKYERRED